MSKLRLFQALALMSCLFAASAGANGINPPRPVGSETVMASCTDRTSSKVTILQRVRIAYGDASAPLEVRLGKTPPQAVQLSKVRRIQFHAGKPKPDGFAKAMIEIEEPPSVGEGAVKVRANKRPVRISGFSPASEHVEIALENCKELEFTKAKSKPQMGGMMLN